MIILKEIIPFEKEIKFDSKIAQIENISLEHFEDLDKEDIEGYFLVSGEYKVHQISVNLEKFEKKIPFNIEVTDNIIRDSIKFDIDEFSYDIKDNDTLLVKIDLAFNYELKEDEEELTRLIEIEENNEEKDKTEESKEDKVEIKEEIKDEVMENTYVTYHVYLVTAEDTIESICLKYNIDKDTLHEYNDFDELSVGSKLLIPIIDE